MASGDKSDIIGRIKRLIPRWFTDLTPVLDAALAGAGAVLAFIYSLIAYARLQTRILTATDGWLDMIAADFFALGIQRKTGQTDGSFRAAILANMFRERGTRAAVVSILAQLTGRSPDVFEPSRLADTGSYGAMCGYGLAGVYGSMLLPYQAFVTAYRPIAAGIPLVAGYGIPTGAYSTPSRSEYASLNDALSAATDLDINAAIESVRPVGTVIWTRVKN